jgi:hypothetical protein
MTDSQIIFLGLQMILDNLEISGYSETIQWQMKLRINRMLAGCNWDSNPEAKVLDYNIYKLGLTLLLKSNLSNGIKRKAENVFERRLGSGK